LGWFAWNQQEIGLIVIGDCGAVGEPIGMSCWSDRPADGDTQSLLDACAIVKGRGAPTVFSYPPWALEERARPQIFMNPDLNL
jgi:hypothetical protein